MIRWKEGNHRERIAPDNVQEREQHSGSGLAAEGLNDDVFRGLIVQLIGNIPVVASTDDRQEALPRNEHLGPVDCMPQHRASADKSAVLLRPLFSIAPPDVWLQPLALAPGEDYPPKMVATLARPVPEPT